MEENVELKEKKHVSFNEVKQQMEEQNKKHEAEQQQEQAMTFDEWENKNNLNDEVECIEFDQNEKISELETNLKSANNEIEYLKEENKKYIVQIDWYEDIINSFNKLINKMQ